MIDNHLHRKLFSILAAFIVAFCLLFAGMRVPDLARPYRPKPNQKAVIETEVKASQYIVNNSIDFFAIPEKSAKLQTVIAYQAEFVFVFYSPEVPALFPNSSRAPPLILS